MKKNENLSVIWTTQKLVVAVLVSLLVLSGIGFAHQVRQLERDLEVGAEKSRQNSAEQNDNSDASLGGCQGFDGKWDGGSYGIMTLTQDGKNVTGTYEWKGTQSISGTVKGKVLSGKYYQPNYPEDRYKSGSIRFTLAADGNSWSGTWTDRDGNPAGTWSGKCISDE